ncbi:MAG: hypothetical protein LBQ92_00260, partial [Propionibacteriaceae bacterium]|nr:hypothetical protein [Propionibacteriaceae bacterium]
MTHIEPPTFTLVVNPAAGQGKARKLLPHVVMNLLSSLEGVNLRVFQTTSYQDAKERCHAAVANARPSPEAEPGDTL